MGGQEYGVSRSCLDHRRSGEPASATLAKEHCPVGQVYFRSKTLVSGRERRSPARFIIIRVMSLRRQMRPLSSTTGSAGRAPPLRRVQFHCRPSGSWGRSGYPLRHKMRPLTAAAPSYPPHQEFNRRRPMAHWYRCPLPNKARPARDRLRDRRGKHIRFPGILRFRSVSLRAQCRIA